MNELITELETNPLIELDLLIGSIAPGVDRSEHQVILLVVEAFKAESDPLARKRDTQIESEEVFWETPFPGIYLKATDNHSGDGVFDYSLVGQDPRQLQAA